MGSPRKSFFLTVERFGQRRKKCSRTSKGAKGEV
jgi:hypothetical protein